MPIHIMGTLNVTPDSFSDGGRYLDSSRALSQAQFLFEEGASIVDVGADSTRPGSVCVGHEVEWQRLEPVVKNMSQLGQWSIDTHSVDVAKKALSAGAMMINDVSGGSMPMMEVAGKAGCSLVCMYSRSLGNPHALQKTPQLENAKEIITAIKIFFEKTLKQASIVGLPHSQLIFDPGMGAFISDEPKDSFEVLKNISNLSSYGNLLIGVSRKGFLKSLTINSFEERDWVGSVIGALVIQSVQSSSDIYLRTHTPRLQRLILNSISA